MMVLECDRLKTTVSRIMRVRACFQSPGYIAFIIIMIITGLVILNMQIKGKEFQQYEFS